MVDEGSGSDIAEEGYPLTGPGLPVSIRRRGSESGGITPGGRSCERPTVHLVSGKEDSRGSLENDQYEAGNIEELRRYLFQRKQHAHRMTNAKCSITFSEALTFLATLHGRDE